MKRKTANSPYPILYPAECSDIQGYGGESWFDVGTDFTIYADANHDLVCSFSFDLKNEGLKELIEQGKAEYYVNIESSHAYYRKAFHQKESLFKQTFSHRDIVDSVELYVGVVAADEIPSFKVAGFLPKFKDRSFPIEKGHILAVGPSITADIPSMDGNIEPVLMVVRDKDESNSEIWVETSKETLFIHLSPAIYDFYALRMSGKQRAELFALVVKPAIQQALTAELASRKAKEDCDDVEDDKEGKRWLRVVIAAMEKALDCEDYSFDFEALKIDSDRGKGSLGWAINRVLGNATSKAIDEMNRNLKKG